MNRTDIIIISLLGLIAVIDVTLILLKRRTFSRRMRKHGRWFSALPAAWGVIGGHFWGPSLEPFMNNWPFSIGIMLTLVGVVVPFHMYLRATDLVPKWFSLVYVVVYIPVGVFFWPQY